MINSKEKRGVTIIETIVALTIISLLMGIILNIVFNYLLILNSIKERLIALSLAQEGLELAIALRNKNYEKGEQSNDEWLGVIPGNNYCIEFNTTTAKIVTSTPNDSNRGCKVPINSNVEFFRILRYSGNLGYYPPPDNNMPGPGTVAITSEVYFLDQKISLTSLLINRRLLPP
ncbi:MAG: type II secretion system GspH family protein [Patescibacteria group bacterium]|nr:type II secretion system GspH family protein [Patescibacteria group bacterium]